MDLTSEIRRRIGVAKAELGQAHEQSVELTSFTELSIRLGHTKVDILNQISFAFSYKTIS